jgi:hypothetical protein
MRRIGRYILDRLTVLSLVLFTASVALCVRSYRVTDTIFVDAHRALTSEGGSLDLVRYAVDPRGGLWMSSHPKHPSLSYYDVVGLTVILPLTRLVLACRRSPVAMHAVGVAFGILAALSACALVGLLAWRLFGTPITYRSHSWSGNGLWLRGRPKSLLWYGTYQSYDLPLYDWKLPYWLALVLTGLLPVAWVAMRAMVRRHGRFAPGFCQACGYDLRATPDRCPECGHVRTALR